MAIDAGKRRKLWIERLRTCIRMQISGRCSGGVIISGSASIKWTMAIGCFAMLDLGLSKSCGMRICGSDCRCALHWSKTRVFPEN